MVVTVIRPASPARLAALVPKPRLNLTRFRGVRAELQIPDPDRAAASAGPDGSRQAAGAHELGAASEAMGIRH